MRAKGFVGRAFERMLGHERYRWMPSLGNPLIRNPRADRRVTSPTAAHQLLDLALDVARQRRRVIFFCSCPCPDFNDPGCHRRDVTTELLRVAGQRGEPAVVEDWPGGQPARMPIPLHVPRSAISAARLGRQSISLPKRTNLQNVAGLPWGTLVELRAGEDRQLFCAGPAQFNRWFADGVLRAWSQGGEDEAG